MGHQTFSIDDHRLSVIEADGGVVEPYVTTRVSIAPGQRYSVLVTANQTSGTTFWLWSEMDSECLNVATPNLEYQAKAVVTFDLELRTAFQRNVLRTGLPQTSPWPRKDGEQACHDESPHLLRPLRSAEHGAPLTPLLQLDKGDKREIITVTMPKLDRNGLVPVSWINRTQWRSPTTPLLHSIVHPNTTTFPPNPSHQLVLTPSPSYAVTRELIINNSDEAPHPFHLHGHKFSLIATYESSFDFGAYSHTHPNTDAQWFDEQSAPVRDTVSVPRRGFAVIRWRTDNPGVWALHCHVLVHMQTGMALAVVKGVGEVRRLPFVRGLEGEMCAK